MVAPGGWRSTAPAARVAGAVGVWARGSAGAGGRVRCVPIVVAMPAAGLGAGKREGLVDLDSDLVAGLGGDVGFVDAIGVGLDAFDGGAGVLGEGGGLHLGCGGPGEDRLVPVPTVPAGPTGPAVTAGLGAGDGEGL